MGIHNVYRVKTRGYRVELERFLSHKPVEESPECVYETFDTLREAQAYALHTIENKLMSIKAASEYLRAAKDRIRKTTPETTAKAI